VSRPSAALRIVAPTTKPRRRYANDGDLQTLKYPGELVLTNHMNPVMIVREGSKLERWNGLEGREGSGVSRD
jgi:hypothetical protein